MRINNRRKILFKAVAKSKGRRVDPHGRSMIRELYRTSLYMLGKPLRTPAAMTFDDFNTLERCIRRGDVSGKNLARIILATLKNRPPVPLP